jgi:predicted acyl esterase
MRSVRLLALVLALSPVHRASAATVASVFGGHVPCVARDGVQFCQGKLGARVESFDGVPLDVDVTLPPADRTGPFPLIVDLHGWGLSKTDVPFVDRALAGYVVVSYTARGFGASCGTPASRASDATLSDPDACVKRGWIRLADARYEAHDTQHIAGLLADEGLVRPDRVGVTGASYGGGQSLILGALRNRIMQPDGTLVPWKSPGGLDMTIAAAAPLIPWSDLAQALTPNGRTLDYRVDNPYGTRAGVQKKSWEDLLYGLGAAFYYAPSGADPEANLPAWHARISQGEPYDGDALLEAALDELTRHHSAYYIDDSVAPAPLFIYNSWTDDLFPGDEALRFWRKTHAHHPEAEIFVHLADSFGHPRASLAPSPQVNQRVEDFFARYLKKEDVPPPPPFETFTQACGGSTLQGPFAGADWDALRHGEVRLSEDEAHTFASTGGSAAAAAADDPIAGGPCRTVPAMDDPGAAVHSFAPAAGAGYTLLGAPTVIADIDVSGSFAQIVGRLWDVAPGGTQSLVTHIIYRPRSDNLGPQVFELHPNGWHFAAGHVPKLELVGQSAPYGHPAVGTFTITVRNLELRLPVVESPDGGAIAAAEPPVLPPDASEPADAGVPACGAAPAAGCHGSRSGRLKWKKGKLAWTWTGKGGDTASLLGVPDATTAYRLCVWDASSRLVTSVAVPAGGECTGKKPGPCWTKERTGFRYLDRAGTSDGTQLLELSAKKCKAAIRLRGKIEGASPGSVRAQLRNAIGGCWETGARHAG